MAIVSQARRHAQPGLTNGLSEPATELLYHCISCEDYAPRLRCALIGVSVLTLPAPLYSLLARPHLPTTTLPAHPTQHLPLHPPTKAILIRLPRLFLRGSVPCGFQPMKRGFEPSSQSQEYHNQSTKRYNMGPNRGGGAYARQQARSSNQKPRAPANLPSADPPVHDRAFIESSWQAMGGRGPPNVKWVENPKGVLAK